MNKCVVLIFFGSIFGIANAQKFRDIDSIMRVYEASFQPEKIHLHYDKHWVKPGETVWFKAYLMTGSQPVSKSTNLYVDIYSQTGKLLQHTIWPIVKACAIGSIQIPAVYKDQIVQVKAYTAWMRNFDSSFFYRYRLKILDSSTVASSSIQKSTSSIRFYPEGGSIATNAPVNLAFKVTNAMQEPVSARGWILTSTGDTVTSFSTVHDGMGVCTFNHVPGLNYSAVWKDERGIIHVSPIPEAIDLPAIMHVVPGDSSVRYTVLAKEHKSKARYHLVAYMHQQLIYRASFNLSGGEAKIAEIPTGSLPSGVLQLSLLDDNILPLAERVVFIHGQDLANQAAIFPDTIANQARNRNVITIQLPDTLSGTYSVSVSDAVRPMDSSYGIISQLLLSSELRGYIHNADWYFRGNYLQKRDALDLVMLTNGWRKYDWVKIKSLSTPIVNTAAEEHYMRLTGMLYGVQPTDLKEKDQINLIISGKDSSKQILAFDINSKGLLEKDDLLFFDTATIYYSFSKNKLLNKSALVQFSTSFQTGDSLTTPAASSVYLDSTIAIALLNRLIEEQRAALLARATTLKEVIVRSRIVTREDVLNQTYVQNGLFKDATSERIFDVMNDVRAISSFNVIQYLKGIVPGLNFIENTEDGTIILWRGDRTALFLNEMQVSATTLESFPMSDIALVKVFRPPFFGAPLGGSGGAIAVYTKKGAKLESETLFSKGRTGLLEAKLAGYTPYKEFASTDYAVFSNAEQKDTRPTLYWNPMILTDETNKKIVIQFYNNDVAKAFRVVLEGMNEAGKLVRVEKILGGDQPIR